MTLQSDIRRSVGAANTQCKSLKSITKGNRLWTYIILNPCSSNRLLSHSHLCLENRISDIFTTRTNIQTETIHHVAVGVKVTVGQKSVTTAGVQNYVGPKSVSIAVPFSKKPTY
jgi:hypothetical protein